MKVCFSVHYNTFLSEILENIQRSLWQGNLNGTGKYQMWEKFKSISPWIEKENTYLFENKKNFSNEIYFVIIFMLNKKFTFSPAVWVSAGTEPN